VTDLIDKGTMLLECVLQDLSALMAAPFWTMDRTPSQPGVEPHSLVWQTS